MTIYGLAVLLTVSLTVWPSITVSSNVQQAPGSQLSPEQRAALLQAYTQGSNQYSLGDFKAAVLSFQAVVRLMPELVEGYLNLGVSLEALGRHDEARDLYHKALRDHPTKVGPYNHLCTLLIQDYHIRKKMQSSLEAQVICVKAVEVDPEDSRARENLGNLYTHLFRFAEAIEHYKKALSAKPRDKSLIHNLAQCYSRAHRAEEAIQLSVDATRMFPYDSGAFCNYGTILQWVRRYDPEVQRALTKCCELAVLIAHEKLPAPHDEPREVVFNWLDIPHTKPDIDHLVTSSASEPAVVLIASNTSHVYGRAAPKLYPAKQKYVELPLYYNEKQLVIARISNAFMEGDSGIIYDKTHVYTGTHGFNSRLNKEYTGAPLPVLALDGPVVSILSQNLGNYYHAMAECVVRLLLSRKYLFPALKAQKRKFTLLVPAGMRHIDEVLELLRIKSNKDFTIRRYRATSGSGKRYSVSELFYLDWKQVNQSKYQNNGWDNFSPSQEGLQLLRRTMINSVPWKESAKRSKQREGRYGNSPLRVVFISRNDAGVRKMNGEDALVEALTDALEDEEFIVFQGNGKTVREQIKLFRATDILVAGHGAGLSNMIYLRKGASVLMFPLQPNVDNSFLHMAMALELNLVLVPSIRSYYFGMFEMDSKKARTVVSAVRKLVALYRKKADSQQQQQHKEDL